MSLHTKNCKLLHEKLVKTSTENAAGSGDRWWSQEEQYNVGKAKKTLFRPKFLVVQPMEL